MKSRKSVKKSRALAEQNARLDFAAAADALDPAADQHLEIDRVRTEQEQGAKQWSGVQGPEGVKGPAGPKGPDGVWNKELDPDNTVQDGSAAANHQDLDAPALPTNRLVSYPRRGGKGTYMVDEHLMAQQDRRYSQMPEPKMPSAHFDIKANGEVETLVQPGTQEFTNITDVDSWRMDQIPADFPVIKPLDLHTFDLPDPAYGADPEFETITNDEGTVNRKAPLPYDWSLGTPQFVEDLETAIEAADLADHETRTASEIANELLRHPALHGYLEIGEIAHTAFVPDCEYQNHVELDDPEEAHTAQFERYAGHTGFDFGTGEPTTEQEFLGNGATEEGLKRLMNAVRNVQPEDGMERWLQKQPQLMAIARAGIDALQELAGMAAEHKGFHEDRPVSGPELTNWQGNKLMLIVSEAVEAHDEIRSGHSAYETYYPMKPQGFDEITKTGSYKPEGVPSEIADVVIRAADFAWTEGFDLADIIIEKLEYNATRGHKHGKAF